MTKALIVLALGACIVPAPSEPHDPDPNARRRVAVLGALLGPGKSTGGQWDGIGGVDVRPALHQLGDTLATQGSPYAVAAKVAAFLSGPTVKAFEAPDAWGRAELYVHGQLAATQKLYIRADEFQPQWTSPPIEWTGVDIRSARVRIVLIDIDVGRNDAIGTVDIDSSALLEAARSPAGRFPFRAAEQTRNQILFVDLSVL